MPTITLTKTTKEVAEISEVVYEKYSKLCKIAAYAGFYLRPTQLTGDGESMGLLCEIVTPRNAPAPPTTWVCDFIARNTPVGSVVFIDDDNTPMVELKPYTPTLHGIVTNLKKKD